MYPYALTLVSGTTDVCTCESKFAWDASQGQCLIKCNELDHSQSVAPNSYDSCTCEVKFLWDEQPK